MRRCRLRRRRNTAPRHATRGEALHGRGGAVPRGNPGATPHMPGPRDTFRRGVSAAAPAASASGAPPARRRPPALRIEPPPKPPSPPSAPLHPAARMQAGGIALWSEDVVEWLTPARGLHTSGRDRGEPRTAATAEAADQPPADASEGARRDGQCCNPGRRKVAAARSMRRNITVDMSSTAALSAAITFSVESRRPKRGDGSGG